MVYAMDVCSILKGKVGGHAARVGMIQLSTRRRAPRKTMGALCQLWEALWPHPCNCDMFWYTDMYTVYICNINIYIYRLYCDILCILRYIMRCETGSFHFFSHRPGIETCSVTGFFPCTNEPNFCVMVLPTVGVSRWFAKEGIAVMAGRPANICTSAFSSSYLQVPTSDAPIVSTPTNRSLELFRQESHSTANSAHASATCTWASGILAYQKCCRRNAKLDQGQENDLSSWPGLHEEIHCMLAVHVAMSPNTSTKLFHEVIYRYL